MPINFTNVTMSGNFTVTPPPTAPTIGTATTTGSTTATVTFTAPSTNFGSTITSYTAVSSPGGVTGSISQSGSGTITVTGLSAGTNYTFTVYATSIAGNGASSGASNQITTYSVPNAPTIGTATVTGTTTATIAYTAPTNNGGLAITSYTAVSSPGGVTGTISQSGSGTITIYGLTPATSYTFTVYATNSIGNSSNSSASNSITTTLSGVPDAPVIGTATATGSTTATVTYTESPNQGRYGLNFPGVLGSYISSPSTSVLALGTSDFTVEFWFNTTTKKNSYPILVCNGDYTSNRWQINDRHFSWPNVLSVSIYNNSSFLGGSIVGTTTIANGTWYHVAFVRSGSTFKLYLNGVQEGNTLTFAGSMDGGGAQTIYIGQDETQGDLTSYHGRISNLRIVKNVVVYTGNFTVPIIQLTATQSAGTNISAITGTSTALLVGQTAVPSKDNSTNNFTMTVAGTAGAASQAPFGDVRTYTAISSPSRIIGSIITSASGTITVSGLSPNSSYTFTVVATNGTGTGPPSLLSNSITTNP